MKTEKKEQKKQKKQNGNMFANNIYALRIVWNISKSRVLHSAIMSVLGYVEWLFITIVFLRYVINAVDKETAVSTIFMFLGLCTVYLAVLYLYYGYVEQVVNPITSNKIYRILYRRLYAKARNVELRCFEDVDFYNKYTMALDGAADKMTQSVNSFFAVIFGFFAACTAFYAMFSIDPWSVLFTISPIIGNFVFGGLMVKIWTNRYKDCAKPTRIAAYVNRVIYLAEYAKEIRFSSIHDLLLKRYDESVEDTRKIIDKYSGKAIVYTWLQNVTTFVLVFEGIMIYAAYRTMVSKTMGLAELAIMFSAMSTTSWILIGMFHNLQDVMKNGEFLTYFRGFVEYQEAIPEDQEGIIPEAKVRSIEFRKVSFAYQDEKVVHDLSFCIEGDKVCALVGHNGAGKSTILKLLFRLYDPTEGVILVNGIDIRQYQVKAYRDLFAAAFQDYKLMAMSVMDNVLMGTPCEEPEKVVRHALKRAGVLERVEKLPEGIHTIMTKEFDEEGAVLSGGEQQKIVVARAFAKTASVKVFDEPSSALDPIAEYELYQGIMKESKGHITLFISHRLSSVKDADEVFMLENGTIVEQGSHKELMALGGQYQQMYNKQAENYLAVENFQEGAMA